MALWGDKDNIESVGIVTLNYSTGEVTGSGTSFGQVGSAQTGDVIRFGTFPSLIGDAVVVGIASTTVLTIGSTTGLSGAAISGEEYTVSQLPKYTVLDSNFSQAHQTDGETTYIAGVSTGGAESSNGTVYEVGVGWVGVTTYMDNSYDPPQMRVKKEILVAMSGIQTGNTPLYDDNPLA